MLSSYNDQRSMQQTNMQLNQQLLNQQYQMNSQFSRTGGILPTIILSPNSSGFDIT